MLNLVDYCDVINENKWPIGSGAWGKGGSKCTTGKKIYGVDPTTENQFKQIQHMKEWCRDASKENRANWGNFKI